jgi:altronate dehydratase large subunit
VTGGVAMFRRADGRVGARNHMLVLPSVVCSTRVARDVAAATHGVAIVHQHGCSQVGDDAVRTRRVFESVACSPNVGAVVVVGLGCETIQGRELAAAVGERGQQVEFVGIQDVGGSDEALAAATAAVVRAQGDLARAERDPVGFDEIVVGLEASRESPLADAFARCAGDAGAAVVVA